MMLRSSSTPVLGSLLASLSDSPGNTSQQHHVSEFHGGCAQRYTSSPKISCGNGGGYPSLGKSLFHSSPSVGIRRAQSEGNLGELVDGVDEFRRPARKANWSSLEAIPSFSTHGQMGTDFDSEDEEWESQEEEEDVTDEGHGNNPFKVENLVLKQEGGRMYLAAGLGVSGMSLVDIGGNGGRGGSSRPVAYDREGGGDGSDRVTMEQHYRKMLEGDPGNPMVLRNYAQFLYQEKGDLKRAEEYYSRAILADPKDGEILSQYGKLIWELHRDEKRAACYFERAIQASAEDSHVQAAYASFLWDAEEDLEGEGNAMENTPIFHHGPVASATA